MAAHGRTLSTWSADDAGSAGSAQSGGAAGPGFFPVNFQGATPAGPPAGQYPAGAGAPAAGAPPAGVWVGGGSSGGVQADVGGAAAIGGFSPHGGPHPGAGGHHAMGTPQISGMGAAPAAGEYRFGDPADDLPLLQELGVYPDHILAKSLAVLHPLRDVAPSVADDTDLAGPVCIAMLLSFLLTLQGKMHFGAIYGLSVFGVLCGHGLLFLMSDTAVPLQLVMSTLGYCLLPNIVLGVVTTLHLWIVGKGVGLTVPLAVVTVAWSAWCAAKLLTTALQLRHVRWLVLYPTALLYAVFAALTIF